MTTPTDRESQISREIASRHLKYGINAECKRCLRILKGCDGKTGAIPCLAVLDWEKHGEVQI